MSTLHLRLEARARARALHCHRSYEITVGQDLFGIWIAEMAYGRIGTTSRTKTRSFASIEDVASVVDSSLRRRATLPRRLGAACRLRSVEFDGMWKNAGLLERLAGFMDAVIDNQQDLP
jgi:predicted DNA-binding WGR domain protein